MCLIEGALEVHLGEFHVKMKGERRSGWAWYQFFPAAKGGWCRPESQRLEPSPDCCPCDRRWVHCSLSGYKSPILPMLPGTPLYPEVPHCPWAGWGERRLAHFCVPGLVGYARLCPGDQYEVQPGRSWEGGPWVSSEGVPLGLPLHPSRVSNAGAYAPGPPAVAAEGPDRAG